MKSVDPAQPAFSRPGWAAIVNASCCLLCCMLAMLLLFYSGRRHPSPPLHWIRKQVRAARQNMALCGAWCSSCVRRVCPAARAGAGVDFALLCEQLNMASGDLSVDPRHYHRHVDRQQRHMANEKRLQAEADPEAIDPRMFRQLIEQEHREFDNHKHRKPLSHAPHHSPPPHRTGHRRSDSRVLCGDEEGDIVLIRDKFGKTLSVFTKHRLEGIPGSVSESIENMSVDTPRASLQDLATANTFEEYPAHQNASGGDYILIPQVYENLAVRRSENDIVRNHCGVGERQTKPIVDIDRGDCQVDPGQNTLIPSCMQQLVPITACTRGLRSVENCVTAGPPSADKTVDVESNLACTGHGFFPTLTAEAPGCELDSSLTQAHRPLLSSHHMSTASSSAASLDSVNEGFSRFTPPSSPSVSMDRINSSTPVDAYSFHFDSGDDMPDEDDSNNLDKSVGEAQNSAESASSGLAQSSVGMLPRTNVDSKGMCPDRGRVEERAVTDFTALQPTVTANLQSAQSLPLQSGHSPLLSDPSPLQAQWPYQERIHSPHETPRNPFSSSPNLCPVSSSLGVCSPPQQSGRNPFLSASSPLDLGQIENDYGRTADRVIGAEPKDCDMNFEMDVVQMEKNCGMTVDRDSGQIEQNYGMPVDRDLGQI